MLNLIKLGATIFHSKFKISKKSEFIEENGWTTKLGGMLLVPFVHLSKKSVSLAAVCSSLYAVSMCVASIGQNHHLKPWRS